MMYILCDLIEPNLIFSNGTLKYVQYLRGKPAYTERIGYRILVEDPSPQKYRVLTSRYDITEIKISIVDQSLKQINFGGEEFTIQMTIESA